MSDASHLYTHCIKLFILAGFSIYFPGIPCISRDMHLQNLIFQPSVAYRNIVCLKNRNLHKSNKLLDFRIRNYWVKDKYFQILEKKLLKL